MEEKELFNEKQIISEWLADMYDCNETDISDIEFALSVIGNHPKHILEIACGSGRILVPMANAGHIVTGLDFDEYMLNKISAKSVGMQNIFWRKSDAIKDEWGNGYDVVMLAANLLFNIITDIDYEKAQALLIKKSANALDSDGHIYIDCGYTLNPERWFSNSSENVIWKGMDSHGNNGRMVLINSTFDKKTGLYKFIRRFELTLADGSLIKQDISSIKHFATIDQIHGWLESSGFVVEEEYGDYNRNPIGYETNRAIIWARKK